MSFEIDFKNLEPKEFSTSWRSPSNIAFVKYWGKKGHQIPANPSLSMTLKNCYTETKVHFRPDGSEVELFLDGVKSEKFALKIKKYLDSLEDIPLLKKIGISIETKNTFPHGTGIASSASGLSAFALGLTDYLYHLQGKTSDDAFFKSASFFSRLASGSACRSVYGGFTTWGSCDLPKTSDLFATEFEVHKDLSDLLDSVVVVSSEEKSVSSTAGHGQMTKHFFSEARFEQARENFNLMVKALTSGDIELMGKILESEALSLHAMMLTSSDPYILMRPHTLLGIEKIWKMRRETGTPLYFTLDAGPNLHLIYPRKVESEVKKFIENELKPISEHVIHDEIGMGPVKC